METLPEEQRARHSASSGFESKEAGRLVPEGIVGPRLAGGGGACQHLPASSLRSSCQRGGHVVPAAR